MAYSDSPLVTYTRITSNKTSPRNKSIDRITIHCIVGQWTAKQGCDYFATTDRQASCNYVVGKDGSIGLCVNEKDRSWCSSSAANDHRAITIETASDTSSPYAVTAAAFSALIDLCEDICRRNGKKKLLWFADKDTALNYSPKSNEMVMTVHRWFANKSCPGDYLYKRHGEIATEVTARLSGNSGGNEGGDDVEVDPNDYARFIWDYYLGKIGNEYAVAGLMGNLYAESGLYPDRVQGDIPYSSYSKEYTKKVDNGTVSEYDFVHNGPGGGGYGLAQWTYYSRKQGLYDLYKSGGYASIGSIQLACDYLWRELNGEFLKVLNKLKDATSVRMASNEVLHNFERPTDQSTSVEQKRYEYGLYYYNLFAKGSGGSEGPDTPDEPSGGNAGGDATMKKLSKLLLFSVATERI